MPANRELAKKQGLSDETVEKIGTTSKSVTIVRQLQLSMRIDTYHDRYIRVSVITTEHN
jgi:hypothetical protein